MLTAEERAVLKFYVTEGRKHGVAVSIASNADRAEIAAAKFKEQVGDILRLADSLISATVSLQESHQ